ncbi:hypothetical protein CLIM01_09251 [Colletotrichum limetticola]|uniref:Uncharacterized protein n=1 Tax=Colletotrichum limetticola TaxID=1209924 RepID=A0ABQ9PPD1_9PEZI|nr:hypothetical protein CLIM01_09251 [Colletotrichum limetticola]
MPPTVQIEKARAHSSRATHPRLTRAPPHHLIPLLSGPRSFLPLDSTRPETIPTIFGPMRKAFRSRVNLRMILGTNQQEPLA